MLIAVCVLVYVLIAVGVGLSLEHVDGFKHGPFPHQKCYPYIFGMLWVAFILPLFIMLIWDKVDQILINRYEEKERRKNRIDPLA